MSSLDVGRLVVEGLWSVPLLVLLAASLRVTRRFSSKNRAFLCSFVGIAISTVYCLCFSFIAGPMASTMMVPVLPLWISFGAGVGLFATGIENASPRQSRLNAVLLYVLFVVIVSSAYYYFRSVVANRDSISVVVVEYRPSASPLKWVDEGSDIQLSGAQREQIQQGLGANATGLLKPVLRNGAEATSHATAILLMSSNVSKTVILPQPKSGTVVFVQRTDGSWQTIQGQAIMSRRNLRLYLSSEYPGTQIEVEMSARTDTTSIDLGRH